MLLFLCESKHVDRPRNTRVILVGMPTVAENIANLRIKKYLETEHHTNQQKELLRESIRKALGLQPSSISKKTQSSRRRRSSYRSRKTRSCRTRRRN